MEPTQKQDFRFRMGLFAFSQPRHNTRATDSSRKAILATLYSFCFGKCMFAKKPLQAGDAVSYGAMKCLLAVDIKQC